MKRRGFVWRVAAGVAMLAGIAATASAVAAPKVVMYATSDCGYCAKARAYFNERGVAFEERDIDASPVARREWQEKGGIGTPLILINDRPIQGFDLSGLDAMLSAGGA